MKEEKDLKREMLKEMTKYRFVVVLNLLAFCPSTTRTTLRKDLDFGAKRLDFAQHFSLSLLKLTETDHFYMKEFCLLMKLISAETVNKPDCVFGAEAPQAINELH